MAQDISSTLREVATTKPGVVRSLGPTDEIRISAAEARLGLTFPQSYRDFVREFGAMEVGTRQVYGIGDSLDAVSGLNVVWHTEQARAHRDVSQAWLVVSSWDDLTLELAQILDDSGDPIDGPVVERLVEGAGERLAGSFAEWLERTVQEALEDASS